MILGLHHVTATVDEAQPDLDFCLDALGLRLVKKTVNFDNHHVYHFYYGDERGTPGTIWTTFPYKGRGVPIGRKGAGQITVTSFSVPSSSLDFWKARLRGRGLTVVDEAEGRTRVAVNGDAPGKTIDVVHAPDADPAMNGLGTVHHVAMAIADGDQQLRMREELERYGCRVTEVRDRCYFTSIYFREPGGVLFEVATVPPGFTIDEDVASLGRTLRL